MPSDPLVRRVLLGCGAVILFGVGVFFGWTMVRFPRFRGAEPAPTWLPWLAAALTIGPLAFGLAVRSVADALGGRTPDGPPPARTRASEGTGSWRSSTTVAAAAVISLFAAGLAVASLASVDSASRWDPLRLAAMLPLAALVVRWWVRRRSA